MVRCDYRTAIHQESIETAFQHLAEHLNSEINTLGYPRAALFGFCVALAAYIIMSVIKSALGRVHGTDVIENQVSGYYLADRGMMIAIDDAHWLHLYGELLQIINLSI